MLYNIAFSKLVDGGGGGWGGTELVLKDQISGEWGESE